MPKLTATDVTNLYLYGQIATPSNLLDENLIRPEGATKETTVNIQEFMESAGRFAIGSQFNIINMFFTLPIPSNTPEKPYYSKIDIAEHFGLSSYNYIMQHAFV